VLDFRLERVRLHEEEECSSSAKAQGQDECPDCRAMRIGARLLRVSALSSGDHGRNQCVLCPDSFDDNAEDVKGSQDLQHAEGALMQLRQLKVPHAGERSGAAFAVAEQAGDDNDGDIGEEQQYRNAANGVVAKMTGRVRGEKTPHMEDDGGRPRGKVSEPSVLAPDQSPYDPKDKQAGNRFSGVAVKIAC
jgi:hypothetical protein